MPDDYKSSLVSVVHQYHKVKREGALLMVPFTTVSQYLFYLREIASLLNQFQSNAVIYLAAAVSDFYVQEKDLVSKKKKK